ncbi:MAG: metal ABC transporter substrate-binding protein [Oscillospiraceae bacterium]|jgi:zinc transport system substrate-binding protein|nr:metal ABC transporter substrate-binding protein [Oscillospiraceae bacterium]
MKQFMSMAIAVILAVLMFAGCGSTAVSNKDNGKISVVSTVFSPYDFTRQITGDKAEITMLLPPAAELHSFEPTPQDIIKIQNCDVFIYVGGESDEWVREVFESMDTSKMKIVTLIDCVEPVEEVIVDGMEDEEEEATEPGAQEEPEYDEHVWTSPGNAKLIVQKISDTVCEIDSANANTYKSNTASYLEQLDELDGKFKDVVDNAVRKTIVFGDRFPFRYFADAYGLEYFAAFPGCSTETEASAKTVTFLIDKINEEAIPVVFHIELSNEKMVNTIAESTGAKVCLLHACHNISKDDFDAGKTYMDLMSANAATLKEALQ